MKPKEDHAYDVLVVDDSVLVGQSLTLLLSGREFVAQSVTSTEEARKALVDQPFDLVITELMFPSSGPGNVQSGIDFIQWLKRTHPQISIVALSASIPPYLDNLFGLGVPIISKASATSDLIDSVRALLFRQVDAQSDPLGTPHDALRLEDIRRAFAEEATKLLALQERTLTIPGEGTYELSKPLQGFKEDIERHFLQFPFEQNVFLMMKFRSTNRDVADYIIETLRLKGFRAVRADDREWNITNNVYNPMAVLYCCKYGIALFDEPEEYQAYSPNVAYELGIMHYQNKKCLILKHALLPQVPFDIVKAPYVSYDRDLQLRRIVEHWIDAIAAQHK